MKRLSIAAIAVASALSLSLPALAAPETYAFDANHTVARFEYVHFGYSNQIQRFNTTTGKVTIDRAAKTGSADVTIDTNSINTGVEVFNGHLKGEDFFNAEKFPTITFKSTAFKFDGDKPSAIDGNLTIKGVTKPVTLTVTSFLCMPHPLAKKDACGANATTKIKRSEFNAGKYAPYVSDDVTITVAVEAFKE
jgi:polyisoprenoid-binding protein YceI